MQFSLELFYVVKHEIKGMGKPEENRELSH